MIKLYYQAAENNFGDVLSAKIVEQASGQSVEWVSLKEADLVALGSLGERVIKKRLRRYVLKGFQPLKVWGTGFLAPGPTKSDRFLDVYALRGKLSAARIQTKSTVVLGDPGLLSSYFWPSASFSRKGILCMSHTHDEGSQSWVDAIKRAFPEHEISQISICSNWEEILLKISQSLFVVSTAMHPLIVAASYNVPFLWISSGTLIHSGADYKFKDFFSVFSSEPMSIDLTSLVLDKYSRSELDVALNSSSFCVNELRFTQKELLRVFPVHDL